MPRNDLKIKLHMPRNDLKIKRFVERGQFSASVGTIGELIEEAGGLLDDACASEIIGGGILFQGEDGKWYTASTEVVVAPANKQWVKEVLGKA